MGAGEVATAQPGCGALVHRSDSGSARRRGGRLWGIVDIRADGAVQGREHEVTAWTVRGIRLGMGSVWACVIHTYSNTHCPFRMFTWEQILGRPSPQSRRHMIYHSNRRSTAPTGQSIPHRQPLRDCRARTDRSHSAFDTGSAAILACSTHGRLFQREGRHSNDRCNWQSTPGRQLQQVGRRRANQRSRPVDPESAVLTGGVDAAVLALGRPTPGRPS